MLFLHIFQPQLTKLLWTNCFPQMESRCWEQLSSECLSELHSGRYEGAQQHRCLAGPLKWVKMVTSLIQKPKESELTTQWRNKWKNEKRVELHDNESIVAAKLPTFWTWSSCVHIICVERSAKYSIVQSSVVGCSDCCWHATYSVWIFVIWIYFILWDMTFFHLFTFFWCWVLSICSDIHFVSQFFVHYEVKPGGLSQSPLAKLQAVRNNRFTAVQDERNVTGQKPILPSRSAPTVGPTGSTSCRPRTHHFEPHTFGWSNTWHLEAMQPSSLAGVAPAEPLPKMAGARAVNDQFHHAQEWRPRHQQGWLNRWVHLASLVMSNHYDEAKGYIL